MEILITPGLPEEFLSVYLFACIALRASMESVVVIITMAKIPAGS